MLQINRCQISANNWVINLPNITVADGELLVITGPSGLGKSTFLHWVLGDTNPHVTVKGEILVNSVAVHHQPVEQRQIGLLMQQVYLFPHLTVLDNICFALANPSSVTDENKPKKWFRGFGVSQKKARQEMALTRLAEIDLAYLAERYPHQLSGGEQSRVGLLRALVNEPKALLMDEPFASLDPKTGSQISQWALQKLQQQGIASIMVSHDLDRIPTDAQHLDLAQYHRYIDN